MCRHAPSAMLSVCLVLLGAAQLISACPASCDCPSTTEAVCWGGAAPGRLPPGLSPGLTSLALLNHNLSHLDNFTLAGLPSLTRLQLNSDGIRWVQPGSFRTLKNLQTLELQDNWVEYLQPDTFITNGQLWFMDLSGNNLHAPGDTAFLNSLYLRELNMSRCHLDYLPDEAFQGLPQLRVLHLEGNYLHFLRMRMLSPLQQLTHLYMQNNMLNILLNVPTPAGPVPSLTHVDLSGNQLKVVEVGVLQVMSSVREVDLQGNPLLCNCLLEPARGWLDARAVRAPGRCAAPYSLAGADWRQVTLVPCSGAAPSSQLPSPLGHGSGRPLLALCLATLVLPAAILSLL